MPKGKFSKPRNQIRGEASIDAAFNEMFGVDTPPAPPAEVPTDATMVIPTDLPMAAPVDVPVEIPDVIPQDNLSELDMPEEDVLIPSPTIQKNKKIRLIALCSAAVVVLIGLFTAGWFLLGTLADDGKILSNVTVAGVNLGGMTKEEAIRALTNATSDTYTVKDMVVELPNDTLTLPAAQTGAALNIEAAVETAYEYGRVGSLSERREAKEKAKSQPYNIALLPYLTLNTTYIRAELESYINDFNSTYEPSGYSFRGEIPPLEAEQYDPATPCQTLMLNPGTPGKHIDIEQLYNRVLDAYSFNIFLVDAKDCAPEELPEPLDLEAIHKEVTRDPVSASLDYETLEISPEIYGYTFDLARAQELLEDAAYGIPFGIPMEYVEPELVSTRFFGDVMGYCETKHTNNDNRNNNLILACKAIDGMILRPGEEFSYNEALGERTAAAGYKGAPAYSSGKTVSELGGGICQVSSTLYYCALLSDLEITVRSNHSFVSSYIPKGMDATVSWGGPEFKFRNNTEYPIRIEAKVEDGYVKIQITGIDTRDYYIRMDSETVGYTPAEVVYQDFPVNNPEGYKDGDVIDTPYNGYIVKTYRVRVDKETDEEISRTFEATSVYKKRDKLIARVAAPTPEPTPTPNPTPTPTPTPDPAPTPTPDPAPAA